MGGNYQDYEITIREATKGDMAAVAAMIQELANFQDVPAGPKLSVRDLELDGFETQRPLFRCKTAELRRCGAVAGFVLYYPAYSTWEGRAVALQELYVKPAYRRRGAGRGLLREVAAETVASGCKRLDFHVLDGDGARGFCESVGARNLTQSDGACYYRLSGDALAAAGKETK